MIAAWRKQAIAGLSVFSGKAEGADNGKRDKPHAQIGQLAVDREFSVEAFGRRAGSGGIG